MRPGRGSDSKLTVGDLFCGAGGFAEGFRQAGFDVLWGVDNWAEATQTFHHSFPDAAVITKDVLKLEAKELSRVDVVIGSPPCVHFSPANRGGGGDREAGMELVRRFLELVGELSPKYWVMENVPALLEDLTKRMERTTFHDQGVRIQIPQHHVLDSAHFETPQVRRRLFSGNYPWPVAASARPSNPGNLKSILQALPDPALDFSERPAAIKDPVYQGLEIASENLRDHFEDVRWELTDIEADSTEERRLRDRIYGAMPFPDDLDKPARTITATRSRGSRGTFVVPRAHGGRAGFRTLTVRECASAQGFPVTYQFWSDTMSGKDFLVGNAVPPPLARAIATSILLHENRSPEPTPLIVNDGQIPPVLEYRRSRGRRFSMRRHFRGSILVDWRRDHRVELDNELPTTQAEVPDYNLPEVTWRCRAYLGYAELYRCYEIRLPAAIALAREVVSDSSSGLENQFLSRTLLSVASHGINGFPDRFALQRVWSEWTSEALGPHSILGLVGRIVGQAMPASLWKGRLVPMRLTAPILEGCVTAQGKRARPGQPLEFSSRLFVGALSLSLLCDRINSGVESLESVHAALSTNSGLLSSKLDLVASLAPKPSKSLLRQLALPVE